MSTPDGKAGQPNKTTAANKESKKTPEQAAKKVSKADKIWIASIILLLASVAVISYLARSGDDTRPPVVSADEEPYPFVDEESIIEPEPEEAGEPGEDTSEPMSAAATGALVITSDVQGADVYLNGRRVGKTPHRATPLTVGRYRVKVVKTGYETFEKSVEVTDTSHTLRADLKRAAISNRVAAAFRVESNVLGATVALDGEARGTTPVEIAELAPGTYELVVSAAGYKTHSETVDYAGGGRDIRVDLESSSIVLNESVAVKHKHRIRGGCEGVLRASAEGILFETEHKDAFSVSLSELERFRFEKDKLSVKVQNGKSYTFVERNDNKDALELFHQRVDETLTQMGDPNQQD